MKNKINENRTQKNDGLEEKLIKICRTAKVVKGGRIFGFTAVVSVGDKNGKVGIGFGKAREVPIAIQKAMEHARKNLVVIDLYKDTVYHPITIKYGSTKVIILPASQGTGIIAGNAMRAIFEVSGIKNIVAKCIGSTNPIKVVRATIKGLIHIMSPDIIAQKRNIPINKILEMKKC